MLLLVGLGNPGAQYEKNRHNVGFMVVDRIADDYNLPSFRKKFSGFLAEGTLKGRKTALLKPGTFMNLSGQSVAAAAKFFKIDPSRIVVFHDELDLEPGKVRVRLGGGLAGHNGLKSLAAHLGTQDFWRVRIGIGHPGDKSRVSGYVLSDFPKAETPLFENVVEACSSHIGLLIENDSEGYMNKVALNRP